MKPKCRHSVCDSQAGRYSPFCAMHAARKQRHGHPDQLPVTKSHLKPFQARVQARVQKNPENPAWGLADGRWTALVGRAEGVVKEALTGRPMSRYQVHAAREVVKLGGQVEPREVVETVAAMFVMRADDPRRFRDHDGFRVQLARRVRGLGETAVGRRYDHAKGRSLCVYKDAPLWATLILGDWLAEALGPLGLHLAALEARESEAKQGERERFHEALRAMA